MEEESSSWIRRTKYSHTVCHRLASIPLTIQPERNSGLISMGAAASGKKSVPGDSEIQRNPLTNKQRAVSPTPQNIHVPDSFREARSQSKRFSTPHPRRKESDKGFMGKFLHKESPGRKSSKSAATSPLTHLGTMKFQEKVKSRKDSAWAKYFDHGGGRVTAVEAADEHTVDLSKLFLGLRFAHGAHSRLYHGIYEDEPVAVKIITVPDGDENGDLAGKLEKQFNREVTLLSRLHHRNVIKFVGACKKPPVYCIMTEYLAEGSLRAYLHKLDQKSLPLEKIMSIATDIAHAMEYIHSHGVIHRDLKPENVLIDENFHLKIADFGIACEEAYCDLLADDPGTYRWMAPEMIKKKSYGRKVDVYSFGLILWELVAGTIPYEDMNPIQAAFAVVNKNLRPVIPGDCPSPLRALIEQCWSLQPDKRPEFGQIVKALEQFESSIKHDGTLNQVQDQISHHKKGFQHWIQKLGSVQQQPQPSHSPVSHMPKPKFT